MGAIGSRVEVVESVEEDHGTVGTPVKCSFAQRQLDEDPRSPTTNIPRTPIMVDKTPDADGLIDPRSPTPGIWRTPINNFLKKDDAKVNEEDSKPLLGEGENYEQTDRLSAIPVDLFEETKDEVTEDRKEESQTVAELQSLSLSDVDESSSLLEVKADKPAAATKKPKQKTQPKKLFYDKKRPTKTISSTPKSVLSSMTPPRSPLSTVVIDTNSPRVIMQRKQTKKIDAARQCRLDAIKPSRDKENV